MMPINVEYSRVKRRRRDIRSKKPPGEGRLLG